ncbi:hypothetical protein [Bradyrhizobium archetypum]|uniref:Uncharacterized protein n=1 Tax=Bradyrhizobium archetypum TaxID=2721160 RepID=A0A7Y4H5H8_9BRAD|nr:hypothetical protein [Bradyrhizobium archetypum]NOJ47975.1 hypothetical protein [Bradyrhizobium archetypum]
MAITLTFSEWLGCADYSTVIPINRSMRLPRGALRILSGGSIKPPYICSFGPLADHAALAADSFGSLASSLFFAFSAGALSGFFAGLPYWASFSSSASKSARPRHLLEQLVGGVLAQACQFFDAQ